MKKYLLVALMILVVSAMVLTGCGEKAETTTTDPVQTQTETTTPVQTTPAKTTPAKTTTAPATTPVDETVRGGTLKFIHNASSPVNPGNPAKMASAWDYMLTSPAVETLFRATADGTIIPFLAETWSLADDFGSYTITLRKGIKFHDGADFNAEAVKFNLDRYLTSGKAELKAVSSIEILDDYKVRLNLSEFDSTIPYALSMNACAYMISPNAIDTYGEDLVGANPVGTGPFKFVSWQRDVSMVYEKFDGYRQPGKPYLDKIEIIFISDPVVALASFKSGEGDVLFTQQVKEGAELRDTGKYDVVAQMSAVSTLGVSVHPDNAPLANVKVRQAIAYAVNKEAIAKTIGYGMIAPAEQLSVPGLFAYNPDIQGYPYNPEKAKELLVEAGYPDGFTIKLQPLISGPLLPMWEAVQGYLDELGLDTEIEPWNVGKFFQGISEGWEGMTHLSIGVAYADPLSGFIQRFKEESMYTSILYIPAIEDKLRQAAAEADTKKKQQLIWDAQKMIIDEYCIVVPIWAQPNIIISYPQVHNLEIGEPWTNTWTPEEAWLGK